MKKVFLFTLAFCMLSVMAFADDRYVDPSKLPASAKTFLNTYFKGVEVVSSTVDFDSYDVYLSNGVEIDFTKAGAWDTVDGNYQAIPTGFIPKSVLSAVKGFNANAKIVKIDKEWNGYEVDLDSGHDLKISTAGKIIEVDR